MLIIPATLEAEVEDLLIQHLHGIQSEFKAVMGILARRCLKNKQVSNKKT